WPGAVDVRASTIFFSLMSNPVGRVPPYACRTSRSSIAEYSRVARLWSVGRLRLLATCSRGPSLGRLATFSSRSSMSFRWAPVLGGGRGGRARLALRRREARLAGVVAGVAVVHLGEHGEQLVEPAGDARRLGVELLVRPEVERQPVGVLPLDGGDHGGPQLG